MQKIYFISCCAECPAYTLRMERLPHCEKQGLRIEGNSEDSVNPAIIGFPEWCPLENVGINGHIANANYKKEVKQIMRIMENDSNPDALVEASHYLNKVIEDAKKKTEPDQLQALCQAQ